MRIPKALRELESELSAEVFLVGGAIRDLLRGKTPNDLDFVVRNVSPGDFEAFLRQRGELKLVGRSFGVYLFKPRGRTRPVEVAFPRTEVSTGEGHRDFVVHTDPSISIECDAARRDFTLNALYIPIAKISGGGVKNDNIVDFHKGVEHIRQRIITAVGNPEDRINEDPLRMLRAMVLVARTGFRLEGKTFTAIRRNSRKIRSVSAERVRDEFIKIMMSDSPSRAFKAMRRTGLLQEVLPELSACVGCGQNPKYHSYPVFEHLIYAADAACQISDRLDVRLGALFHDLGKAPTRAVREGGDGPNDVTFHNHELESTKLAFRLMCRLCFPRELTEAVVQLVRQHQYKYDRDWSDKAVRRFIRAVGITEEDLKDLDNHPQFLVRQADRMGNALKRHLPITQKQRDFQERIRQVFRDSTAHSLRDLKVNGNDLIRELGLPSGPLLGKALKHLYDVVESEPALNTRDKLLEKAKAFISENRDGDSQPNGTRATART